jgi:hypothetical protein
VLSPSGNWPAILLPASTIRLCLAGHGVVFDLAVMVETLAASIFAIGMGIARASGPVFPSAIRTPSIWRRICLRMSLMQDSSLRLAWRGAGTI